MGAILYEMLTTRRPMHRGASTPSASNPKVPKEIDAVVLKALAPNPASRYQSAVGLAGELRASIAVLDQLGVGLHGRFGGGVRIGNGQGGGVISGAGADVQEE